MGMIGFMHVPTLCSFSLGFVQFSRRRTTGLTWRPFCTKLACFLALCEAATPSSPSSRSPGGLPEIARLQSLFCRVSCAENVQMCKMQLATSALPEQGLKAPSLYVEHPHSREIRDRSTPQALDFRLILAPVDW
jgi:hypothetical protein